MPNILVADDNPVSLRFFGEALAQFGFESVLARDGIETVAQAIRIRFELLLLDARMPGLDGPQALARIRAEPGPSRDAPALATTADAGSHVRRELLDAGFLDVIVKPVTVDALRATLARHLGIAIGGAERESEHVDESDLDDARALAAAGGDASIMAALRRLLVAELDALPAEMADIVARNDRAPLHDRLHRLDASAGFCGAPALVRAAARLRPEIATQSAWPDAAIADFLIACAEIRARLAESAASGES